MMPTLQEVESVVIESVRLLAEDFDLDALKEANGETDLYGDQGTLDSMALVNLIADVEDAVHNRYGLSIALADEKAVSARHSPFRSVQSLTEAVLERLPESG